MSKLVSILRDLGTDAKLEEQFQADPQSVIEKYDLSQEEADAILKGDIESLRKMSGLSSVAKSHTTVKAY